MGADQKTRRLCIDIWPNISAGCSQFDFDSISFDSMKMIKINNVQETVQETLYSVTLLKKKTLPSVAFRYSLLSLCRAHRCTVKFLLASSFTTQSDVAFSIKAMNLNSLWSPCVRNSDHDSRGTKGKFFLHLALGLC